MALAKADFYYGALLSRLVGTGFAPAIIEEGDKRRIYSLANDFGDYTVYAKYASKPNTNNVNSSRWNFQFSSDELTIIEDDDQLDRYIFAFICEVENLRDSEIVLLTRDEFVNCIGEDYISPNRRISIKTDKGSWNFYVYGTGRDVKKSLKITRNIDKRLKELSRVHV